MSTAVVFGAGGIGRGFLGALCAQAGWRVVFVDVAEALVERLAADGGYRLIEVSSAGEKITPIAGVSALLLSDEDAVVAELVEADLAATAVGAENLPPVARLLSLGLAARQRAGRGGLDALVCENLHDAPEVLRRLIDEQADAPLAPAGLARTSIGRMVPVQLSDADHPTDVRVEPYSFLPYEASALVGEQPSIPGLVPVVDSFDLFADRKLYLHNMGHAMLAYLGEAAGLTYIWEAAERFDLRYFVRSAMVEAACALAQTYATPVAPLLRHVDDLLARFRNPGLGDTTARVGRDPVRKMQPGDRLLGAYKLCLEAGIAPLYVTLAVALGTRRLAAEPDWDEAKAMAFVVPHLGPDDEGYLSDLVAELGRGLDPDALLRLIDARFAVSRVV